VALRSVDVAGSCRCFLAPVGTVSMNTRAIFVRFVMTLATAVALSPSVTAQFGVPPPPPPAPPSWLPKLDPALQRRAFLISGNTLVVVRAVNATSLGPLASLIQQNGGTLGRPLSIINGRAAKVPNVSLAILANSALVQHLSID